VIGDASDLVVQVIVPVINWPCVSGSGNTVATTCHASGTGIVLSRFCRVDSTFCVCFMTAVNFSSL
jgi:hypothetical protein